MPFVQESLQGLLSHVCNREAMAWADEQHQTLVLIANDNFRADKTLWNQVIVLKRR